MSRPTWLDNPKLELWIAWAGTAFFYSLYGFAFFILTRTQPPGKPWYSAQEASRWFATHHAGLLIGFALIFALGGLSAVAIGLISYSIRRMSVSRAFAHSYLVLYLIAAIPGFLFICVAMTTGAMRPDRAAELQRGLFDLAFLSFAGTMGVFLIGSLVWSMAILLDKNKVFPKWFGYLNLCNALTEVVTAPAVIVKRSAFAWDGQIVWWINVVVWGFYTFIFIGLLRQMILREDFGDGPLPALAPSRAYTALVARFGS